ncbi:hypothetical protein BDV19DRAFT_390050 [Aspergillus venezuelensis]
MYPWRKTLEHWSREAGFHIDALGLLTLLGADEMNRSVGRLMPTPYFHYLPLLGAFTVAGNRFVEKVPGFTLYNIDAGLTTTELAGWFSRWLRAQDFRTVRSKVTWRIVEVDNNSLPWRTYTVRALLVAVPVHGILIALAVLTGDWWGFTNVISMIISVAVRCSLVAQNQAGIDANIEEAERQVQGRKQKPAPRQVEPEGQGESMTGVDIANTTPPPLPPAGPNTKNGSDVKVLVVTDESKVITIRAPAFLIKPAFTTSPNIPCPSIYLACRAIGWVAFAVHVISIGMAALYTQILSVGVIIIATIFTAYKVGCEDSQLARNFRSNFRDTRVSNEEEWTCRVTSRLEATVSTYPAEYTNWDSLVEGVKKPEIEVIEARPSFWRRWSGKSASSDVEKSDSRQKASLNTVPERRRDLYVWLELTSEQEELMIAWSLMPRNAAWMKQYCELKEIHHKRNNNTAHADAEA